MLIARRRRKSASTNLQPYFQEMCSPAGRIHVQAIASELLLLLEKILIVTALKAWEVKRMKRSLKCICWKQCNWKRALFWEASRVLETIHCCTAFCNRPLIRILFDAKMFQSFFPQYQKDVVVVASFSIFYSKNGP